MSINLTVADLPAPPIRAVVLFGVGALVVAVAGFGTWSAHAPLGSAVIAQGQLTVEAHIGFQGGGGRQVGARIMAPVC
jgi:hypothetical protein